MYIKQNNEILTMSGHDTLTSWTVEYVDYLMTERHTHKRNAVYECVDKDAESIYGSSGNINGALFLLVETRERERERERGWLH